MERRKAVCKALTRVVRGTEVSREIDPKAFFMMLNANYAVLYRDEAFDLTPLWEALAAQHDTQLLTGLFLKFDETLQSFGLTVVLPPQISGLTEEQQHMHVAALEDEGQPQQETEVVEFTDELDDENEEGLAPPLALGTADLRPVLDEEQRREIVQAVVSSVRATELKARVDGGQLAYLVDNNFDSLCDGRVFNIEPVFQGLRDLGNVSDRDLYLAAALLIEALRPHGIALNHQRFEVSEAEGQQLLEAHHRAVKKAQREALLATDAPAPKPSSSSSSPDEAQQVRAETRQTQLRRLGLGHGDGQLARRLRLGVMAALLLLVTVPSYLYRSSRPLSVGAYSQSVPLKSADLQSGAFVGHLDEAQWWPLSLEERSERLVAFETVIRAQGFADDLQVRDSKNQVVIAGVGNGRLRGAPLLMRGRADGTMVAPPSYASVNEKTETVSSQDKKKNAEKAPPKDADKAAKKIE